MANFYLSKALWKMSGEGDTSPTSPWIRPCLSLQLANSTLESQGACFENHTAVVAA